MSDQKLPVLYVECRSPSGELMIEQIDGLAICIPDIKNLEPNTLTEPYIPAARVRDLVRTTTDALTAMEVCKSTIVVKSEYQREFDAAIDLTKAHIRTLKALIEDVDDGQAK